MYGTTMFSLTSGNPEENGSGDHENDLISKSTHWFAEQMSAAAIQSSYLYQSCWTPSSAFTGKHLV